MIGQVIGSYRLDSELGRGGMGLVMLAKHIHLNRPAAIKFLQRNLCDNAEAVQRFLVEARATAEIQHPGIVQIYDCGILPDGGAFIIMELLEGETLQASLTRRGSWPLAEAAATLIQIVDALAAAHRIGIVHRDLKPENIFLLSLDPGRIKLVDFGIAKLAERDYSVKTLSGVIIGTPRYMSPEQCRGSGEVDHRSDIYSLGCVLFEMLTGHPAFPQAAFGQVIAAHQLLGPPDPRVHCPDLPQEVATLILAMLAKSPEGRPSLAEIKGVLATYSSRPITAPGIGPSSSPHASQAPTQILQEALQPGRSGLAETTPPGHQESISGSTLRQAPGEQPPDQDTDLVPRRRDRRVIAAGAIGIAAIAVIGLLALRPHKSAPAASQVEPPPLLQETTIPAPPPRPAEREPPPSPEPVPVPAASVAHPRAKATSAARAAASSKQETSVTLTLTSVPPGALICNGSDRIGVTNTPALMHRSGKKQTLTIYKSGYRLETVTLVADRDVTKLVKLRPLSTDDLREPPPCR